MQEHHQQRYPSEKHKEAVSRHSGPKALAATLAPASFLLLAALLLLAATQRLPHAVCFVGASCPASLLLSRRLLRTLGPHLVLNLGWAGSR